MKKLAVILAALAALSGSGVAHAKELYYPDMVFDATFEEKHPEGNYTRRIMSDGKGHIREETVFGSRSKLTSLKDFVAKTLTITSEPERTITKCPLNYGETEYDEKSFQQYKPLGTKTVEGHPCHGFATYQPMVTLQGVHWTCISQFWIGDDIHYLVLQERNAPRLQDSDVTRLKSWSTKVSDDICSMPSDYKEKAPVIRSRW